MRRLYFFLLLPLILGGCALLPSSGQPLRLHNAEIHGDTVWQGEVVIEGQAKVFKGASLTLLPGTRVSFVKQDLDQDGLGDGTLIVEGELHAVGTPDQPVLFRSAASQPQPGDWLEIRVDFAHEIELRYCELRDSAYTLHAHFTHGVVSDCTIHDNIDGCRIGQANVEIHHNLVAHNRGKGINFRNSQVDLHHNIIRNNGSGVFLFETDRGFSVRDNNIFANDFNFRLGDFFTTDVALQQNWWGSSDPAVVSASLYDQRRDPQIGAISVEPTDRWVAQTGPREQLTLQRRWLVETDGFIDAPPLVVGDQLLFAGWDGQLRSVDASGQLRWSVALGDTADAALASDGERLFVQTWSRQVLALSLVDGHELWRFEYPASVADDHRQGGLVVLGDILLVPAWNGHLYALDKRSGTQLWAVDCGQPLRAAPLVLGELLVQPGGSGQLTVLDRAGTVRWQKEFDSPLLNNAVPLADSSFAVLDKSGLVSAWSLTGEQLWQQQLAGPAYYAAPVAAGGKLYVATAGGILYRLDPAAGTIVWQQQLPGASYATPCLLSRYLLVADNSGALSFYSAESGDLLTRYQSEKPLQSTPVWFADQLVFGGRDHLLHALALVSAAVPE